MELVELCNLIELPREATEKLARLDDGLTESERQVFISQLTDAALYDAAWQQLKQRLGDDPHGLKMLSVMLRAACESHNIYRGRGISDDVFVDTMKCFSRFADEYTRQNGIFGFDREFWTGRQLSLTLFRLGTLEYELTNFDNIKEVAMHIPSGADISSEKVDDSLRFSREFCRRFFPEHADVPYVITSWVLCPALNRFLPPNSNLIKFQNRFKITAFSADDGYKQWVFGNEKLNIDQFPQNTTLQRGLTSYIRNGGKMGAWTGYLIL